MIKQVPERVRRHVAEILGQPDGAEAEVTVTIDGESVDVATGTTILKAMRKLGKDVPTLCYSDRMQPYGACRTCLVEQVGGKTVASCHTPVREGGEYITRSKKLSRLRYNIAELIVSDHPLECLDCTANNRCELQAFAAEVGLRASRFEAPRTHNPPMDNSHPFIKLEMDKCIGCAKCVRACDEVQGSFVLGMEGRGFDVRVIAGNGTGFEDADCVSCGQCVFECPVAALEEAQTRTHGLPDKTTTTTCSYCGVGCSLNVNSKDDEIINIEPNPEGSANLGHTCVKGRFAHQFTYADDRLTSPLVNDGRGNFREVSWDEANRYIAENLTRIRDQHGPAAFASISSSRCTNEENYLMNKFTRVVMQTNNIDNCSRICHSPSAFALNKALGTGAGTNSFQDVEKSRLVVLIGTNTTEAHPVFGARIKQAVLKGCRLIVLDPRNIELSRYADMHLKLRPGTNVSVLNAMQHVVLSEGLVDEAFVARHAEGYEALRTEMKAYTPEWAHGISGVPADLIREAARAYATSGASQLLWGLGVTEGSHGTESTFALINLAVMTGNIGRAGTGAAPIRGQNNVQGASDVGALPDVFSDYRSVFDEQARADHRRVWGVETPLNKGLRIPDMFDAAHAGTLKAMYVLGEDIAQSDPDTAHVVGALEALEFLVVQDLFLCETARYADVVLPGSSFLETDGTFTNSDRRIQRVRQAVKPPEGCHTDGDVINGIARAMGVDFGFDEGEGTPVDTSRIMDEIAELTPAWGGVSYERLDELGVIQWPCPSPDHAGTETVHADGDFLKGKASLRVTPWQDPGEIPDEEYPFYLTTTRMLFHYNVGTMTRRTDITALDKAKEERVRLHPSDARRMDVCNGEMVDVVSRRGRVRVRAEVTRATNPGTLFMTFHYPETRTNILVGEHRDEYTGCPEYKVNAVRLEKLVPGVEETFEAPPATIGGRRVAFDGRCQAQESEHEQID
ncbi:MAG: formate dehydrogenase subunit alpha [Pseudomonadota bacterium]